MASKYRPTIENMHGLPLLKHPLELKFKGKSSSPNTLNASGGAIDNRAQQKANFPRVDRNIGSLPLDGGHHHSRTQNSPQGKHVEKKKKQVGHGRSNAKSGDSLPIVAKASGPQEDCKPSSTKDQRVRTRRRHDIILSRPATIAVVVKYQLGQHELKKFKACFKQIDLNSSGVIDCDEFFEFIDETKTPFSESLFRMIDADSNGTIDFEEFVHATVLYCMYTRDEILHFAFDTFDTAATGSIGDKDLRRLVSMVNDGQSKFSRNINNGLSDFDHNKDGVIDFEEFRNMNKRFPMLLFPCFRLQDRMQKATLGDGHWLQLHKRFYERLKMEHYQVRADLMAYPLFVSLL